MNEVMHYAPYNYCKEVTDENSVGCVKLVTCKKCLMILQAEFEILNMYEKGQYLRCPICRNPLKPSNYFPVEDCTGHVSLSVQWECPDHPAIYWDTKGNLFIKDYSKNSEEKSYEYINGLRNALGSFARQLEVEIYKKDENKFYKLPFKWGLEKKAKYTSNEEGDILSRKWKFQWIYKNVYFYSGTKSFLLGIFPMIAEIWRYNASNGYKNPHKFTRKMNEDRIFGLGIASNHHKRGYRWLRKMGYALAPLAGVDLTERR